MCTPKGIPAENEKAREDEQTGTNDRKLQVLLIGCGPTGMSLLHALQTKKNGLDPESSEYQALPEICCYERGPGPGGVWREVPDDDIERKREENKILQYEDLWLNNPKELTEYFDYTWDDHFQCPTPSFLPRRDVFEYIVERHSRSGSLDNVNYNHTVEHVKYDDAKEVFVAEIRNNLTGMGVSRTFDRCLWACGSNGGNPIRPNELTEVLSKFNGKVYHSVEAIDSTSFEKDVRGKRVMMVGSSNSAEDLSLRAIKHGVDHIYVCSRKGSGDAASMGSWPRDKVTIVLGTPYHVEDGTSVMCGCYRYEERSDDDEVIEDVDTIILCTGYDQPLQMLDESLRLDTSCKWTAPPDLSLRSPIPGLEKVEAKDCWGCAANFYPSIYDSILLVSNPKMMFPGIYDFESNPILQNDVRAWLTLSYLTGDNQAPSIQEMEAENQAIQEAAFQHPFFRQGGDWNFDQAMYAFYETEEGKFLLDHEDERTVALYKDYFSVLLKRLAGLAKKAKYPVDYGNENGLTAAGEHIMALEHAAYFERAMVKQDPHNPHPGATFRDSLRECYVSLHTGTPSLPLPAPWLQLHGSKGEPTKLETLRIVDEMCDEK